MEKYIFFGESTVGASGSSLMAPVSAFLGCQPAGANETRLYFDSQQGDVLGIDTVAFDHSNCTTKEFMRLITQCLYSANNNKVDFEVILDLEKGRISPILKDLKLDVTITLDT